MVLKFLLLILLLYYYYILQNPIYHQPYIKYLLLHYDMILISKTYKEN